MYCVSMPDRSAGDAGNSAARGVAIAHSAAQVAAAIRVFIH